MHSEHHSHIQIWQVLFSFLAIASFVFLLGGNLVGTGRVVAFLFGMNPIPGIWICTLAVWLYTIAGGECLGWPLCWLL